VLSTDVRIFISTVAVSIININPLGVDNIIFCHIRKFQMLNISESFYILHATEIVLQFRNESFVTQNLKHFIIIP